MQKRNYTKIILRMIIALLFIVPGFLILSDMGVALSSTVEKIGFPFPYFWAWVVITSEIFFGFCVLFGWKLKYTIWPLAAIALIGGFSLSLPSAIASVNNSAAWGNFIVHLLAIAVLIRLAFEE